MAEAENETNSANAESSDPQQLVEAAMADAQASLDDMQKIAGKAETYTTLSELDANGDPPALDATAVAESEATVAPIGEGLSRGIDLLGDVELHVMVELGRTQMLVEDVLKLADGSVVELDKLAGDPVDIYVNRHLVARGEVLVLNDNFCIRVSEIVDDLQEQVQAVAEQESFESAGEMDPDTGGVGE